MSAWFQEITEEVGIDFVHDPVSMAPSLCPRLSEQVEPIFDSNGDGLLDVYLIQGGSRNPDSDESAGNALFRQQADGTFLDVSSASGLDDDGYGMGCALGDIDNDGRLDVYVTNYGDDRLFSNNADETFTEITKAAGIAAPGWSTSAAFLDYDGDGWLDLVVARYLEYHPLRDCFSISSASRNIAAPCRLSAPPDFLFRNLGNGHFENVSEASGVGRIPGCGLGVVASDFNADGLQDIFVANDGEENHLWLNTGDGSFREQGLAMGVALNLMGKAEASMGIALGDVDEDGDLDLFLTHLHKETNTLYLSMDERGFEDRVVTVGTGRGEPALYGLRHGFLRRRPGR